MQRKSVFSHIFYPHIFLPMFEHHMTPPIHYAQDITLTLSLSQLISFLDFKIPFLILNLSNSHFLFRFFQLKFLSFSLPSPSLLLKSLWSFLLFFLTFLFLSAIIFLLTFLFLSFDETAATHFALDIEKNGSAKTSRITHMYAE